MRGGGMSLKNRYDLFVFDLDGTLIDSKSDIARSANATLTFLGKIPLSEEKVAGFVGSGVRQLMRDLLGADGAAPNSRQLDDAYRYFMDHYGRHCTDHTVFYPGVADCLDALNDKTLAVLTNKPESLSLKILEALGAQARFAITIGGDSLPHKKPDPEGLLHIIKKTGCTPARTLMCGDSVIDVETAARAGCDSLVVLSGFGKRDELLADDVMPRATWTFEDFRDILRAL